MSLTIAETRDIDTHQRLRRAVFIEEQAVPGSLEVDGLDEGAWHLLAT